MAFSIRAISFSLCSWGPKGKLGETVVSAALLGFGLLTPLMAPNAAHAWDPSTTHLQITDLALRHAGLHRQWMDDSQNERGLFSPLRLNPKHLDDKARATLERAIERSHQSTHLAPLGGPYSCPGTQAPLEAQRFCVEGSVWEHDAFGWIHLGVILDAVPSYKLARHMMPSGSTAPSSASATKSPRWFRRAQRRHNEAPTATFLTGTDPEAHSDAASGWSLQQLPEYLEQSQSLQDPALRDEARVKSLILLGMLLHRAQDLSLPANAYGDREAFFVSLSPYSSDRGNAMEVWTKSMLHAADLRRAYAQQKDNAPEFSLTQASPAGLRDQGLQALAQKIRQNTWSLSHLPAPRVIDPKLSASQAAKALLAGQESPLLAGLEDRLELRGWPAQSGYVQTPDGVALAAYHQDPQGRVQLRLDPAIYAQQVPQLLALATECSLQIIDRFAQGPGAIEDVSPRSKTEKGSEKRPENAPSTGKSLSGGWSRPSLLLVAEDKSGRRRILARWKKATLSPAEQSSALTSAHSQAGKAAQMRFVLSEKDPMMWPRQRVWNARTGATTTAAPPPSTKPAPQAEPAKKAPLPTPQTPPESQAPVPGADDSTLPRAAEGAPATP